MMAQKHQRTSLQPLICPVPLQHACYPRPRVRRCLGTAIFMPRLSIGMFPSLVPVVQFPKKCPVAVPSETLPFLQNTGGPCLSTSGVISPLLTSSPLLLLFLIHCHLSWELFSSVLRKTRRQKGKSLHTVPVFRKGKKTQSLATSLKSGVEKMVRECQYKNKLPCHPCCRAVKGTRLEMHPGPCVRAPQSASGN